MHRDYREKLLRAVYPDQPDLKHVADDPLAKDAANVIARLTRELDEARDELQAFQTSKDCICAVAKDELTNLRAELAQAKDQLLSRTIQLSTLNQELATAEQGLAQARAGQARWVDSRGLWTIDENEVEVTMPEHDPWLLIVKYTVPPLPTEGSTENQPTDKD